MNKVRWGVLGAGGIADRRTLPGMMLAKNARLVAVMEVDPARAEELRQKYGALRAYTSDEELIRDPEVDAVYIASPVSLHARQAMLAADAGKHLLIEKPLGVSADQSAQVDAYCKEKGVLAATGFMMRFGACVQAMREAVLAGKIGQVVSCTAQFTCWYPDIPGAWRQKKSTGGGGALTDMGVHVIDLIRYVTGLEVRQVAEMHATNTFSYEVEDSALALLRLENGCLCSVHANFNVPDEAAKWRLEFYGTRGRLAGENVIGQQDMGSVDAVFLPEAEGYVAIQNTAAAEPRMLPVTFGNAYTRQIESLGNSILTGAPLEAPAQAAVAAQRIVEAAYRSNDTGTFINL